MTSRILGRTGLRVSPLTLGAMMLGGRTGPEQSFEIIDRGAHTVPFYEAGFGPNARW